MALISQRFRALSPAANTALLIDLSGRTLETKTLEVIVCAIVSLRACVTSRPLTNAIISVLDAYHSFRKMAVLWFPAKVCSFKIRFRIFCKDRSSQRSQRSLWWGCFLRSLRHFEKPFASVKVFAFVFTKLENIKSPLAYLLLIIKLPVARTDSSCS